jgi:hypothetical protein
MDFPLRHPEAIVRNRDADEFTLQNLFGLQLNAKARKAA